MTSTETTTKTDAATCGGPPLPHLPGHFYFADLKTTDVDGAMGFYGELMGWSLEEIPGAPGRYVIASIEERGKAAIAGLPDEQRSAGVPPHWFAYLVVEDIEAAAARVPELGGEVLVPAFDVFDFGRMCVIRDAAGATLGLWQDAGPATSVKAEHGAPFWFELHAPDIDGALEFYRGLVGWTTDPIDMGGEMVYHRIVPAQTDERQTHTGGAMRQMQAERDAGAPAAWHVYLNVDDADATFTRALELGGTCVMEPHDIPGAGRSCWIADPQGAVFAAMTPMPGDA